MLLPIYHSHGPLHRARLSPRAASEPARWFLFLITFNMVPVYLLQFVTAATLTIAQRTSSSPSPTTSGIFVIPTGLTWDDALARCRELGANIYPVPATPTDPVFAFVESKPEGLYWISRRGGTTCTCIRNIKDGGGDQLSEAPCGELHPAVCRG